MPSTRKQKAKEKRCRQSDVMSDLENMDIMLGNHSRNDLDSQKETDGDLESNGLQTVNPTSEDFRSLINTNSRKNSEITMETARMINNEITTEVTRKLDEIREDLNSQILEFINRDFASNGLQAANPTSEDYRSLINSSSRENSENSIEIARMINNEITSQVTRKLDETRDDINNQVL